MAIHASWALIHVGTKYSKTKLAKLALAVWCRYCGSDDTIVQKLTAK